MDRPVLVFVVGFCVGVAFVFGVAGYAGLGFCPSVSTTTVTAYVTGYVTTYSTVTLTSTVTEYVGAGSAVTVTEVVTESVPASTCGSECERLKEAVRKLQDMVCFRSGGWLFSMRCNVSGLFDWWSPEVTKAVNEALKTYGNVSNPYKAFCLWIGKNIEYNNPTPLYVVYGGYVIEVPTYVFKASETIKNGYGNCVDVAIAYTAMVLNYIRREGIRNVTVIPLGVVLRKGYPYHVIVFIRIGSKYALVDATGFCTYVEGKNLNSVIKEFKKVDDVEYIESFYNVTAGLESKRLLKIPFNSESLLNLLSGDLWKRYGR